MLKDDQFIIRIGKSDFIIRIDKSNFIIRIGNFDFVTRIVKSTRAKCVRVKKEKMLVIIVLHG